jgi:murein DD-endopeptidase MepM/ murein hydrolase activator NlpD
VLRVGEDPMYGFFVVLDHGEGYQTVYAHASTILVQRGRSVRRHEVIALSGSTGQSTAAHLHFEILLDGLPLDPLSMVERPG